MTTVKLQQLLSNLKFLSLVYCIHFLKKKYIYIYIWLYIFLLVSFILADATTHTYHFVKTVAQQ